MIEDRILTYIANDGKRFFSKEECVKHEKLLELRAIIAEHTVYQNEILHIGELVEAIYNWSKSNCCG